jgi:hypothetical protein
MCWIGIVGKVHGKMEGKVVFWTSKVMNASKAAFFFLTANRQRWSKNANKFT